MKDQRKIVIVSNQKTYLDGKIFAILLFHPCMLILTYFYLQAWYLVGIRSNNLHLPSFSTQFIF